MNELMVMRHGETEWSRHGRHTGRTDIPLAKHGEEEARRLKPLLADRDVAHVLVSPADRARRTAEIAGLTKFDVDANLWEWDYGGYEGRSTPDIQQERPGWHLWADGVIPGDAEHPGETVEHVGARTDMVLERARQLLPVGDVAIVAHGHVLRVLTARWLGLAPADGRLFRLGTGTVSLLGTEHDRPVINAWNVPPPN